MDYKWPSAWVVFGFHPPVEGQDWSRIVWDAVVRPGSEVILGYAERSVA